MRFLLPILVLVSLPAHAASYGPYSVASPIATDGDTIRGDVLIWPGLTAQPLIRIRGIDTPELRGNGQRAIPVCEKAMAKAAMDFVGAWLAANHPISISDVGRDKYGDRVAAHVRGGNGSLLASALLTSGHARPYDGGPRQAWCQ